MRFPFAALFFLVGSFIFFIFFAVSYYLIDVVHDAMLPYAGIHASYGNMLNLLPTVFGIVCILFFLVGILLFFVLDSLADEPEYYYRGGGGM